MRFDYLQTRGIYAVDCQLLGDRLLAGILLIRDDGVAGQMVTLRSPELGHTVKVKMPEVVYSINSRVELANASVTLQNATITNQN